MHPCSNLIFCILCFCLSTTSFNIYKLVSFALNDCPSTFQSLFHQSQLEPGNIFFVKTNEAVDNVLNRLQYL